MEPMRDPREALNNIMEALLFTYRYDAGRREFLLITEYPYKSPGSVREFAAFVFADAEFRRLPGDYAPYQGHGETFQAKGPGAFVIQNIRQKEDQIELWFGPNFGGVTVTYGDVRGYTRGSTAEKTGPSEWVYRDSKTNEPFEFDYPFPSLTGPA
ncbi:hypothetical protein GCM10009687_11310 [Asanoa iriomotensis]|uniref:Uncharacterized protein n=1 Tax=Asanoa iriomotensis TaxID=234613 RepID=A0ABQ4CCR7_9ACTN|nr:hypothetical protein Air01nite_66540 [Asanoa iriomotensis]